jgi:hypothetical protein
LSHSLTWEWLFLCVYKRVTKSNIELEKMNDFKNKYGWSVHDFLMQIDEFVEIPSSVYSQAKASALTTKNNSRLKFLFQQWTKGKYDQHVDVLYKEILKTLKG